VYLPPVSTSRSVTAKRISALDPQGNVLSGTAPEAFGFLGAPCEPWSRLAHHGGSAAMSNAPQHFLLQRRS
jgi:hypothetical protein